MRAPVSIITLTLNEEKNIGNCLKSVYSWSDDIYIIDSNSSDSTLRIARRYTDKIYYQKEAHWANLRNWAMRNLPLKHEWVLFLDADERLTEELKAEIAEVLRTHPKQNGFYIKRRFIFRGKWLKHGGLYPKVLRLFRHKITEYIPSGDAEYAKVKGKVGILKHDMIHEDKKSISRWLEKHNKISYRAAEQYVKREAPLLSKLERGSELEGGTRTWVKENVWEKVPLVLRPFVTFFYQYVVQLGFIDGREGLNYHCLEALRYRLLIYSKARRLRAHKRLHAIS